MAKNLINSKCLLMENGMNGDLDRFATFFRLNVNEETLGFNLENVVGMSAMFSTKGNYESFFC